MKKKRGAASRLAYPVPKRSPDVSISLHLGDQVNLRQRVWPVGDLSQSPGLINTRVRLQMAARQPYEEWLTTHRDRTFFRPD
jgi:hypothetical protein